MSSSGSSSHSPGEEVYHTAEEYHQSYTQGSSVASSTITTTPDEDSDSVYTTANQTPIVDIFTALLDSSTGEAPDESSRHWLPQSAPDVNNSQVISPEHTSPNNYIERRGASDISYTYRPTPIDVESQQQRPFLPTSPPSINNNTFPLVTSHTTDSFQGLAPIEEDEMPHDPSGKFTLNPTAPVFVPRQRGQPTMRPRNPSRNPRNWERYGAPAPKPGEIDGFLPVQTPSPTSFNPPKINQTPSAETTPTPTPKIGPSAPKVPLFGSAHGMFLDPNTGLFTGDGAPRKSPYRPDGTLPSKPDLESDRLTNQQYPEPAEDELHLMSKREYTKRMANFGKDGQVQRFVINRPTPLGYQQGTRVLVGQGSPLGRRVQTGDGMVGEGIPLGRRVQTDHGMEGEGSPLGRRVQTGDETDEEGCELGRRMHATDEQQEEQEEEEISMSGLRPHALEEMVAEMAKNEGFQR